MRRLGREARLPPASMPVDGHGPLTAQATTTTSPPPPWGLQDTAHSTPPMHWEALGQARLQPRMPTRITGMSDSDGCP